MRAISNLSLFSVPQGPRQPAIAVANPEHFELAMQPQRYRARRARQQIKRLAWSLMVRGALLLKRWLDIGGSVCGLIALSPLFLVTWLAIRLQDGGRAIFVQQRVGLRGQLFPMYKFRSMVLNAEALQAKLNATNESAAGVLFKMKRDPRITTVGRVIRKLSIDELPQLYNVLLGHMSLVGPRPALPREVEQYTQSERVRLEVKPGITCLWQIGGRSDIDFNGQVRLDIEYIRAQSVWTDVWVLFKTVPVVLLGKGAY